LGFIVARLIVTRLTRPPIEMRHAPTRRPIMQLSPDELIFWQYGFFKLNATIVFTWGLMLILVIGSRVITRRLSTEHTRSRWQNLLEIIVTGIDEAMKRSA
jgi:F0F1-type ATP synthase membrane subunit a